MRSTLAGRKRFRDRGVGGSNPLAPTNSSKLLSKSPEFSLAVHSVSARKTRHLEPSAWCVKFVCPPIILENLAPTD
jgi:hypothetical protein